MTASREVSRSLARSLARSLREEEEGGTISGEISVGRRGGRNHREEEEGGTIEKKRREEPYLARYLKVSHTRTLIDTYIREPYLARYLCTRSW